jgi:hypothetical protein
MRRSKNVSGRENDKGKVTARTLAGAKKQSARDGGELIGRRVGRAAANLELVLAKPRRSRDVDTSDVGVSASDAKAGGISTARRNVMRRAPKATSALEDSRTKPSRKSTRRSANRTKGGQGLEQTAKARTASPQARAARNRVGRGRH